MLLLEMNDIGILQKDKAKSKIDQLMESTKKLLGDVEPKQHQRKETLAMYSQEQQEWFKAIAESLEAQQRATEGLINFKFESLRPQLELQGTEKKEESKLPKKYENLFGDD